MKWMRIKYVTENVNAEEMGLVTKPNGCESTNVWYVRGKMYNSKQYFVGSDNGVWWTVFQKMKM